jgi:hypothetical protein
MKQNTYTNLNNKSNRPPEPFNKIFDIYRAIKKKAVENLSVGEKLTLEFIIRFVDFYKLYDLHENTNHTHILELLLSKRKLSTEAISRKTHISIRTLYRFKKQYLVFIQKSLEIGIFVGKPCQILSDFLL